MSSFHKEPHVLAPSTFCASMWMRSCVRRMKPWTPCDQQHLTVGPAPHTLAFPELSFPHRDPSRYLKHHSVTRHESLRAFRTLNRHYLFKLWVFRLPER